MNRPRFVRRGRLPAAVFLALAAPLVLSAACASVTHSKIFFTEEAFRNKDDAILYIFREESMIGYVADWNVRIDDVIVGVLRQNAYMPIHLTPGVHSIKIGDSGPLVVGAIVEAAVDNPGAFVAKPNETYYLRSKGFEVAFMSKDQGLGCLQSMRYDPGTN